MGQAGGGPPSISSESRQAAKSSRVTAAPEAGPELEPVTVPGQHGPQRIVAL